MDPESSGGDAPSQVPAPSEKLNKDEQQKGQDRGSQGGFVKNANKKEVLKPSALSYIPPFWSSKPTSPFSLEVLKSGIVVEKIDLQSKEYYIIGRHPESCDYALLHPSISRQHAVIQHRDTGEVYLYDTGSSNGTMINKQPVNPKVYVPLRVGDVIKFGQSSRLYVLQGPRELMPEEGLNRRERAVAAYHAQRLAQKLKENASKETEESDGNDDGISWGLREDAPPEEEEPEGDKLLDEDGRISEKMQGMLTDKQRGILEKLQAKKRKIDNMRSEIDRIEAKEAAQEGLTDGQKRQIARNQEAISKLSVELDELQDTFEEAMRGQTKAKRAREDSGGEGGSSDDDDFYDRTARKKRTGSAAAAVENEASLNEKLSKIAEETGRLRAEIAESEEKSKAAAQEGADPLDEFLSELKVKNEVQKISKAQRRLSELASQEAHVRQLLLFIQPALALLPRRSPPPAPDAATSSTTPDACATDAAGRPCGSSADAGSGSGAGTADTCTSVAAHHHAPTASPVSTTHPPVSPPHPNPSPTHRNGRVPIGGTLGGESAAAQAVQQREAQTSSAPPPSLAQTAANASGAVRMTLKPTAQALARNNTSALQRPHGDGQNTAPGAASQDARALADEDGFIPLSSANGAKQALAELNRAPPRVDASRGGLQHMKRPKEPLRQQAQDPTDSQPRSSHDGKERPKKAKGPKQEWEAVADDYEWVPPTDQRGDGRTKLNDLFGY